MTNIQNKFPGKDITEEDIKSKFPLSAKRNKDHFSVIKVKDVEIGGDKIPMMAGPNTVENEEMALKIAENISKLGNKIFRGGAFKPLSFPYRSDKYFEPREKGLDWLKSVKEKFGLLIVTEVMDIRQIDNISKVADILQIGTRNMQNYPLLVECAKTNIPILLKRHYGASLRDFLGSAEYILNEGNKNVILCERGVSIPHTHRSTSRFSLDLQIIPAAKEITHLPIITDPSHATFWADWVEPMALASIGAGADGVMIEVHNDPKNAAVDPLQPLDFKQYKNLLIKLKKIANSLEKQVI